MCLSVEDTNTHVYDDSQIKQRSRETVKSLMSTTRESSHHRNMRHTTTMKNHTRESPIFTTRTQSRTMTATTKNSQEALNRSRIIEDTEINFVTHTMSHRTLEAMILCQNWSEYLLCLGFLVLYRAKYILYKVRNQGIYNPN